MVKRVWKELKPDDLQVLTDFLSTMPEEDRPLYGITGIKTSLWSQLGGGANQFVALFLPKTIVFSKRTIGGIGEKKRHESPLDELTEVSVRKGPMLDSAKFVFTSGFQVRVGNILHGQITPVTRILDEGIGALEWDGLSAAQKTNCYFTFTTMGLLPRDLL